MDVAGPDDTSPRHNGEPRPSDLRNGTAPGAGGGGGAAGGGGAGSSDDRKPPPGGERPPSQSSSSRSTPSLSRKESVGDAPRRRGRRVGKASLEGRWWRGLVG